MQLKSIRTKLIISGMYVLLLGTLLVGMTLGKYQETKIAYASFGAATFNTVILGDNTLVETQEPVLDENGVPVLNEDESEQTTPSGEYTWNGTGEVNEFGININTANYMPGMEWNEATNLNTAEEFPFVIANGRNLDYASEASVEYYVRLRTLNSLPLEYTLTNTYMLGDVTKTENFITGEPTKITLEDTGDTWYEYIFYVDDGTAITLDDGTIDTSGSTEAIFTIYGGALGMNEHSLILEWPSDGDANDVKYMKEIETLQILVTSSSKNMLEDEEYMGNVEDVTYQSSGIIILDPATGEELNGNILYTYEIDYRSFVTDETQKSFLLSVDNGVRPDGDGGNTGVVHSANSSNYTVWLKVPYAAKEYGYVLYPTIGDTESFSFDVFEYRVYDVKTGDYTSYTNDPYEDETITDTDDLYVICRLETDEGAVKTIYMDYASGMAGVNSPIYGVNNHKLVMTSPPSDEKIAEIAFANKLELWLENAYN